MVPMAAVMGSVAAIGGGCWAKGKDGSVGEGGEGGCPAKGGDEACGCDIRTVLIVVVVVVVVVVAAGEPQGSITTMLRSLMSPWIMRDVQWRYSAASIS